MSHGQVQFQIIAYLPKDAKLGHGVDNAQERVDRLRFLADHRFMDIELDLIMIEVLLHLFAIDTEDVEVHDSQTAAPAFVAVGQLTSAGVEDSIDEGEIVLDLLVAFDVEAGLCLGHRCFEVRHYERVKRLSQLLRNRVEVKGRGAGGSKLQDIRRIQA